MRLSVLASTLCVVGLIGIGCEHDEATRPDRSPEIDALDSQATIERPHGPDVYPGGYYALFFTEETGLYTEFSQINTRSGAADFLWRLQFPIGGDGETSFGWTPFGITFDVDGTMYATQNIAAFDPADVRSQLARIDTQTGEVFPIGEPVAFNTAGGDIDACGNFFVCGFQVEALGYIWGNDSLWQVDKETGEFMEIGPTGHTNWMDLAFDEDGTLWGTFENELYILDTETGNSTFITEIQDVPDAEDPRFMEIMSIAFDKHGDLYGTGLTVYWLHPEGSPVMWIDPYTGETELRGYSQTADYNHGGDIMPSQVKIAHQISDGTYKCATVSMAALPAHLAHGDYVPGSVGYDCECP